MFLATLARLDARPPRPTTNTPSDVLILRIKYPTPCPASTIAPRAFEGRRLMAWANALMPDANDPPIPDASALIPSARPPKIAIIFGGRLLSPSAKLRKTSPILNRMLLRPSARLRRTDPTLGGRFSTPRPRAIRPSPSPSSKLEAPFPTADAAPFSPDPILLVVLAAGGAGLGLAPEYPPSALLRSDFIGGAGALGTAGAVTRPITDCVTPPSTPATIWPMPSSTNGTSPVTIEDINAGAASRANTLSIPSPSGVNPPLIFPSLKRAFISTF